MDFTKINLLRFFTYGDRRRIALLEKINFILHIDILILIWYNLHRNGKKSDDSLKDRMEAFMKKRKICIVFIIVALLLICCKKREETKQIEQSQTEQGQTDQNQIEQDALESIKPNIKNNTTNALGEKEEPKESNPSVLSGNNSLEEVTQEQKENIDVEKNKAQMVWLEEEESTLEKRILTPEGFHRIKATKGSLLSYLRKLELKPDKSPVLLYDGTEKGNQNAQVAVFAFDVGKSDLQQCADSIIRVYSEYLWSIQNYEKIGFHLTNGFFMEYKKWREGYRIKVDGNTVNWVLSKSYNDSYESFREYLTQVFLYAGTLSLFEETKEISSEEIQAGDMFIKGGSPGHCVMIVDIAENENGEKCFLLAQGYMPAQEFHVLKNPKQKENPWYYVSELSYPFHTPEYTFAEGSLRRWKLWE